MAWAAFFIQIVPLTVLSSIATAAGIGLLADRLSASAQLPLAITGLLLFIALITFRETSGYNFGLLLGFSFVAGSFLGTLFPQQGDFSWGTALMAALGVIFLSAAIGSSMGERIASLRVGLWIASWIYLLGWVLIAALDLASLVQTLWGLLGMLIFGGLAGSWFASLISTKPSTSSVSLAIDLYVLGLNLLVAARVMLLGVG